MSFELLLSRDENLLRDLHCGCGQSAQVVWHLPLAKPVNKQQKLSKTQVVEEDTGPKKIQPYGWSCLACVPVKFLKPHVDASALAYLVQPVTKDEFFVDDSVLGVDADGWD